MGSLPAEVGRVLHMLHVNDRGTARKFVITNEEDGHFKFAGKLFGSLKDLIGKLVRVRHICLHFRLVSFSDITAQLRIRFYGFTHGHEK
jgi:hypothetical protein